MTSEQQRKLREHVETAHREVQAAQKLAYDDHGLAPWRVRFALNKAQNILIKLLVHRLSSEA